MPKFSARAFRLALSLTAWSAMAAPLGRAADRWFSQTNVNVGISVTSSAFGGVSFASSTGMEFLLIGTDNGTHGAGILRISTIAINTWVNVNETGFAVAASSEPRIPRVTAMASHNGTVYAATASSTAASGMGGRIFRSSTTDNPWNLVFSPVTTGTAEEEAVLTLALHNNILFAGTLNRTSGGSLWYSDNPISEASWTHAAGSIGGFGLGAVAPSVSAIKEFSSDGFIYAGTAGTTTARGQIWYSSLGSAWAQAIDAPTQFSANSFGIGALEEINGWFYAGTINPVSGAQLWRTQTPQSAASWAQVYSPDGAAGTKDTGRFSVATATGVYSMLGMGGVLVVAVNDPTSGTLVYRSSDGATGNWTLSNAAGFGIATNKQATLTRFNGFAYAATANDSNAAVGRIYRDDVFPPGKANLTATTPGTANALDFTFSSPGNTLTQDTLPLGSSFYIMASSNIAVAFSTVSLDGVSLSFTTGAAVAPGSYVAKSVAGLLHNTTYFVRLWTEDPFRNLSDISDGTTVATLAKAPVTLATTFLGVFKTSFTAAWAAFPVNDVSSMTAEGFRLDAATAVFTSGSGLNIISSQTQNVLLSTLTITGLDNNATYYIQVNSLNWVLNRKATDLSFKITVPLVPEPVSSSATFSNVTSSAIRANFAVGSSSNAWALRFVTDISTGAFPNSFFLNNSTTTKVSSAAFGLGGTLPILDPNTTYYFQARTKNAQVESENLSLGSTMTLAIAPTSLGTTTFQSVFQTSITAAWAAIQPNSIASMTASGFALEAAASDFSVGPAIVGSSSTLNTLSSTLTVTGLTMNTTYFFRVGSLNQLGSPNYTFLGSTVTMPGPPGVPSTTFTSVSTLGLTANWTSGSNPLPQILSYDGDISTGAFPNTNSGNVTARVQTTSAAFGNLGQAPNLLPNSTYFFQARAFNIHFFSPYTSLGSTHTLAIAPTTLASTFTGVFQTSVTASWAAIQPNAASSATCSGFRLDASTGNFENSGQVLFSSSSSNPMSSTLTISGLAINTTYYFRVGTLNLAGSPNYLSLGSTVTTPNPPGTAVTTFTAVTSSATTVSWTSGGNPGSPSYDAEISTGALPNVFAGNVTTRTASTSMLFGLNGAGSGLTPNTTFFYRARVVNGTTYSDFTNLSSTATLANAPVASTTTVVFSSITFSFDTAGNAAGTTFYLEVASTSTFASLTLSSAAVTTALSQNPFSFVGDGLAANTTYFARIRAANRNGLYTGYGSFTSTSTFVADPSTAEPSGISTESITANWGNNRNRAGTPYTVRASSDSFAVVFTSVTLNTSATFSGLNPRSLFEFTVQAAGNNGGLSSLVVLQSTRTGMTAPGSVSTTFTVVGVSSIAVAFSNGGNSPGTYFLVEIATTTSFSPLVSSSLTLNTSAIFGTGGQGAALAPNTTHYVQVKSSSGVDSSAYFSLTSTVTYPAPPAQTTVLSVTSYTVTVDWQPNGHPEPGTLYELWQATESAFGSTLVKAVVSTTTGQATGLSAASTYYFKVRTVGNGGWLSDFESTVSTVTLVPTPGTAGTPSGSALGVSSISWTWTLAGFATSYTLFSATNTAFYLGVSTTLTFPQTGLSPNTTNSIVVQSFGPSGAGPNSAAGTAVYTHANDPTNVSSPTVMATSVTVAWELNSNPSGTTAKVERSIDNATFAGLVSTTGISYVDASLEGCSTYYYRVKNTNGSGVDTGYSSALMFVTKGSTPSPPGGLIANSVDGNKITLNWVVSPSSGITSYRLYYDNGTTVVDTTTVLATLANTATSYTTGVLASSSAYTFLLRAHNQCFVEEKNTSVMAAAASVGSLASLRAGITSPASGSRVSGNRVTVSGDLLSGDVGQVSKILFQYKASTAAAWFDLPSATLPNPSLTPPFYIHWDVTSLPLTNFDLRAVVYDLSNSSDTAPASISVAVDSVTPTVAQTTSGSSVQVIQAVSQSIVNTIQAADGTSASVTTVILPPGVLNTSSANVTVLTNPALPALPPAGSAAVPGMSVDVTLSNGQTTLVAGTTASISFTYQDADGDGIVDRTQIGVDQLQIFSYNAATAKWVGDVDTVVDKAARKVTGTTRHFSFFAGFGVAASNLQNVRIYPNPFRPNGGNPDQGKPFSAGDAASGVIFDRLPSIVVIEIYTVIGQTVAEFKQNGGPGLVRWDARNQAGRDLASGVYIARITSPGVPALTRKILIIR